MALKLRAPYHDSFFVLIILLLLHVPLLSSTSAQVSPSTILNAQSEILQVLVPSKTSFQEFVDCSNGPTAVGGFCIDVFKYALAILIPKPNWTEVRYTCYDLGLSGTYDDMIHELRSTKSPLNYDAVIGDTTISAARLGNAYFTQPYLDSGIVLLTPAVGVVKSFAGVFVEPFTFWAWAFVIASILVTCASMLLIECLEQQSDQRRLSLRGHVWFGIRFFISVPLFFTKESHTSPRSKLVLRAWTFFFLLVGASYTASLSSILTVNVLSSNIRSIDDLVNKSLSIGYLTGSIVKDYLEPRHGKAKLVELRSEDDYANALQTRQVAAIAEESPYISSFLADQPASNCKFLVTPRLTTAGFGFAFRDASLASAFSVAILNLSESGQLQRLQDGWKLADFQCSSQIQSTQLDPKSALGLVVLLVIAMFICGSFLLVRWLIKCRPDRACFRMMENQRNALHAFWVQIVCGFLRRWFSSVRRQTTP